MCSTTALLLQGAPNVTYLDVLDSDEPHNITGELLSPSTVGTCSERLIGWLETAIHKQRAQHMRSSAP